MTTEDPDIDDFYTGQGYGPYGPWRGTGGNIAHRRRRRRQNDDPWYGFYEQPAYGPFAVFEGPNNHNWNFGGGRRHRYAGRVPREVHAYERLTAYRRGGGHRRPRNFAAFEDDDDDFGWHMGGRANHMAWPGNGGNRGMNRLEGRAFDMPRLMGGDGGAQNFWAPGGGNRRRKANHAPFMRMF